MSTAKLAHLGLNVSEIMVLRMISLYSSIIRYDLHCSCLIISLTLSSAHSWASWIYITAIITIVNLAQVKICSSTTSSLANAWEESRIELLLTALSSLSTAIRANKWVITSRLVLVHRLEMVVAIIFKTSVAAHTVPRSHTVGLVAVERAAIRTIVASILALI